MTVVEEQQLCVRCGHVRSVHADGMNDCRAYHELTPDQRTELAQPCGCHAFVVAFNDPPRSTP